VQRCANASAPGEAFLVHASAVDTLKGIACTTSWNDVVKEVCIPITTRFSRSGSIFEAPPHVKRPQIHEFATNRELMEGCEKRGY
jgi:hypothetical protein